MSGSPADPARVSGERAPAGELVLAALFLRPSPERIASLRRAAQALADWSPVPLLLESHGFLGLALRNLALAEVVVPEPVRSTLAERAAVLCALEHEFRLTLELFLAEAGRAGIAVTLLKGASLALDLYPGRGWRSQGDLDLLVAPGDVRAAVRAAGRAGLFLPQASLPIWWHRLVHFHLKLTPETALLREVELHWALEPPANLRTLAPAQLRARRREVKLGASTAFTLDPTDRLLHLVTHLARHLGHAPGRADRAHLLDAAATPGHDLRLKWLLDVRSEVERLHAQLAPAELFERARCWNAENELAWALGWVRDALGFEPEAELWCARVLALLPRDAAARIGRRSRRAPVATRPVRGLDFRWTALGHFPGWLLPPRTYFERRGRSSPIALERSAHALGVLGRSLLALLAFPVALLGAFLARASRRRARRAMLTPGRVLELTVAARVSARRASAP